jgi:hypothetical protein
VRGFVIEGAGRPRAFDENALHILKDSDERVQFRILFASRLTYGFRCRTLAVTVLVAWGMEVRVQRRGGEPPGAVPKVSTNCPFKKLGPDRGPGCNAA